MGTINHRFALSKPALVSAPSKKLVLGLDPRIVAQGQFSDLGMEHFGINGRRGGSVRYSEPNTPTAASLSCIFQVLI